MQVHQAVVHGHGLLQLADHIGDIGGAHGALDEGHNQQDGHGNQHDQALGIAVLSQDGLGLSRVDVSTGTAEQGETDGGGGSGHQGVLHTAAHNAGPSAVVKKIVAKRIFPVCKMHYIFLVSPFRPICGGDFCR